MATVQYYNAAEIPSPDRQPRPTYPWATQGPTRDGPLGDQLNL